MWGGVTTVIRTTRFYEGFTHECEWGETDSIEYELKFKDDLKNWLRQYANRDGWRFEEVADEYECHWWAYDDAKAGIPVGLRFWFGDPDIAVLAKLTWNNI